MTSWRPYGAYRPTSDGFIPRLPIGWGLVPLKRALLQNDGGVWGDDPDGEDDTIVLRSTDQTADGHWSGAEPALRRLSKADRQAACLVEGDLLVTKSSGSALHIGKTTLVSRQIAARRCCYSNFMQRLRVSAQVDPKLAWYFLNSEFARKQLDVMSTSTTGLANLNGTLLGELALPLPTRAEQRHIVQHLDRETARIDALIEKKTRFIELLREKRQALITQAVTRGLDASVPVKDSGVKWLGSVPTHWRVMSLKQVVAIPITDGPHETPEACAEGVPFVSAEAVASGRIDFTKIWGFISEADDARFSKKYRPRRGDIFMVKSGATTGVTAIVDTDERFNIWSPLAVIRCGREMLPEFMLNFMRSRNFQEAIALNWSFGTQQNIGMGVIGNLRVAVPPIEEQLAAVQQLNVWLSRIASLEEATARSVVLLRERRAALITAAVTGQIDVRAEVPEEQAEPA